MSFVKLDCLVLVSAFSALAWGCGDSGGGGTGGELPATCAADDAKACRANQQACSLESDAPTCFACEQGEYVTVEGRCAAIGGNTIEHSFNEFTIEPGEEILGLCQSWTLDNDQEIWVNAVELSQNEQSHHSNWLFVPETEFAGPDGLWSCSERNYDQLSAALVGGVLYAQSTQSIHEVQKFPDGAAVRIPPRSRIIGDVHLLNTTPDPVTGRATLTLYSVPKEEVTISLAPFHITNLGLSIPPYSSSRFSSVCEVNESWVAAGHKLPVDMKIYYALPHTHALAKRVFLEVVGGPRDGEVLLDVRGFNGESRGIYYDPEIDLTGVTGFHFGCEFENPREEYVHWGFGDQEMCEMLGFIASPVAFESQINEAVPNGTEGEMPLFTGACSTIMLPWKNKL